jgi:hypothetical protein
MKKAKGTTLLLNGYPEFLGELKPPISDRAHDALCDSVCPHPARLDGASDGGLPASLLGTSGPIRLARMVNKIRHHSPRISHSPSAQGGWGPKLRRTKTFLADHLPLHRREVDGGVSCPDVRGKVRRAPSVTKLTSSEFRFSDAQAKMNRGARMPWLLNH